MKLALLRNNNHLRDNDYSIDEEEQIYLDQLEEFFLNPRYYLDNFDYWVEYRVSWANYRKNNPVLPRKYCTKGKGL